MIFPNPSHLLPFCEKNVTRHEAKRLIYRQLAILAGSDWWDPSELRVMNTIGALWGLCEKVDDETEGQDFDLDGFDDNTEDLADFEDADET